MPIPGPGPSISMTTIATEFGGTVPHSLSEYYRGGGLVPNTPGNAAIPTSGTISMGNFYGSSNRLAVNLTIAANTNSYDVYANRGPSYVAGISDVTVTINPGVTVGSTSTPAYAMLVPSSFNPGDTVRIVNNGLIQGCGGAAGNGAPVSLTALPAGSPGAGGGSALYVNRPTIVTNNGTIAAGGGGGGGGGASQVGTTGPKGSLQALAAGGGGGGGSGSTGGALGTGGTAAPAPISSAGSNGGAGSSPAGGSGGAGGSRVTSSINPPVTAVGGTGGAGGGRGAAGATGGAGTSVPSTPSPVVNRQTSSGGSGGAAGNYIVGNPFVTWPVTGTRQGNVA